MLTPAKVEGLINDRIGHIELGILESEELERCIVSASQAIAQAHEEDKYDALKVLNDTWHDIEDGHIAKIAKLQPALTQMARIVMSYKHDHHPCSCYLCKAAEQALESIKEDSNEPVMAPTREAHQD
jgi:hypothetical protein